MSYDNATEEDLIKAKLRAIRSYLEDLEPGPEGRYLADEMAALRRRLNQLANSRPVH